MLKAGYYAGIITSAALCLSACENRSEVPRYNSVGGERRLPQLNSEFVGTQSGVQIPAPQPMQSAQVQSMQTASPAVNAATTPPSADPRPKDFLSAPLIAPQEQTAQTVAQPVEIQASANPSDAPLNTTTPPLHSQTAPDAVFNEPDFQERPGLLERMTDMSWIGSEPDIPQGQSAYPSISEVPDVEPAQIAEFKQQRSTLSQSLVDEMAQERQLSQDAQRSFSGESAIPQGYFGAQAAPPTPQVSIKTVQPVTAEEILVPAPAISDAQSLVETPLTPNNVSLPVIPPPPNYALQTPSEQPVATAIAPAPMEKMPAYVSNNYAPVEEVQQHATPPLQSQGAPFAIPATLESTANDAPVILTPPAMHSQAESFQPVTLTPPPGMGGTAAGSAEFIPNSRYVSRYSARRLQDGRTLY